MGYVAQDDAEPARDSVDIPGPTLVLRRNEPVRITVVNHLAEEISRLVTLSEAKGLALGNDRARPFASLRVTHALAVSPCDIASCEIEVPLGAERLRC